MRIYEKFDSVFAKKEREREKKKLLDRKVVWKIVFCISKLLAIMQLKIQF